MSIVTGYYTIPPFHQLGILISQIDPLQLRILLQVIHGLPNLLSQCLGLLQFFWEPWRRSIFSRLVLSLHFSNSYLCAFK